MGVWGRGRGAEEEGGGWRGKGVPPRTRADRKRRTHHSENSGLVSFRPRNSDSILRGIYRPCIHALSFLFFFFFFFFSVRSFVLLLNGSIPDGLDAAVFSPERGEESGRSEETATLL